jgi:hypothetical protein
MQLPIELARQILADARRVTKIPHPPEWEGLSKTAAQEEAKPPFDTRAMPDGDNGKNWVLPEDFKFDLEVARAGLAKLKPPL